MTRRVATVDCPIDTLRTSPGLARRLSRPVSAREATALSAGMRAAMDLIIELSQACDFTPRHLNLGGGFGVVYHPQDAPLDLAALQAALQEISATVKTRWPGVRLNLELGRYLVAGAGIYLTRIVDKKTSRGKNCQK